MWVARCAGVGECNSKGSSIAFWASRQALLVMRSTCLFILFSASNSVDPGYLLKAADLMRELFNQVNDFGYQVSMEAGVKILMFDPAAVASV